MNIQKHVYRIHFHRNDCYCLCVLNWINHFICVSRHRLDRWRHYIWAKRDTTCICTSIEMVNQISHFHTENLWNSSVRFGRRYSYQWIGSRTQHQLGALCSWKKGVGRCWIRATTAPTWDPNAWPNASRCKWTDDDGSIRSKHESGKLIFRRCFVYSKRLKCCFVCSASIPLVGSIWMKYSWTVNYLYFFCSFTTWALTVLWVWFPVTHVARKLILFRLVWALNGITVRYTRFVYIQSVCTWRYSFGDRIPPHCPHAHGSNFYFVSRFGQL